MASPGQTRNEKKISQEIQGSDGACQLYTGTANDEVPVLGTSIKTRAPTCAFRVLVVVSPPVEPREDAPSHFPGAGLPSSAQSLARESVKAAKPPSNGKCTSQSIPRRQLQISCPAGLQCSFLDAET